MSQDYRVGEHYGIHVYRGERPVATFFRAEEARVFVEVINLVMELARTHPLDEDQDLADRAADAETRVIPLTREDQ